MVVVVEVALHLQVVMQQAGTANTGGGGSGGSGGGLRCNGTAGGSGVVAIRYKFQ